MLYALGNLLEIFKYAKPYESFIMNVVKYVT